ncbi:MAG: site-specific DNA-methyltransferase, partial [Burkholderiales bacterium]
MPTLNWIGKDAVVNHHLEVPFRLLKDVPELGSGDPGSGNLIVQGDNLEALKALLPYYAGQVKCIYIDPPYNTGNEAWAYNDNVNSPLIRDWLGKVVGKEGETLDRHDRWLCMMYPRLALLRQLLSEDGILLISIDENEISNLQLLCDEIFGFNNRFANIVVRNNPRGRRFGTELAVEHEYLVAYCKKLDSFHAGLMPLNNDQLREYR